MAESKQENIISLLVPGAVMLLILAWRLIHGAFPEYWLLDHSLPTSLDCWQTVQLPLLLLALLWLAVDVIRRLWKGRRSFLGTACVGSFGLLLLLGITLPPLGSVTEKGKRMDCRVKLLYISLALCEYAQEYDGYFPPASGDAGLDLLRKLDYIPESELFCFGDHSSRKSFSYDYTGGFRIDSPGNPLILEEKPGHHGPKFRSRLFLEEIRRRRQ